LTGAADVQREQQAVVMTMRSPASLAAGVASAKINGVTLTPAEISSRLNVRAMPDSRLVEVTATYHQPEVAAAIVGGVINSYVASNPFARIVGGPTIPARQQPEPMIIVAAAIAGMIGGWIVVTLRKR
jgi:capsular polysaccharide biosynthesis protein